jgi:hypothetical protein
MLHCGSLWCKGEGLATVPDLIRRSAPRDRVKLIFYTVNRQGIDYKC